MAMARSYSSQRLLQPLPRGLSVLAMGALALSAMSDRVKRPQLVWGRFFCIPPVRTLRRAGSPRGSLHMTTHDDRYDPPAVERHWQAEWERTALYQTDVAQAERPFDNLMMFHRPECRALP
jgi:hypothetical protein